jgi:hypothetical protein
LPTHPTGRLSIPSDLPKPLFDHLRVFHRPRLAQLFQDQVTVTRIDDNDNDKVSAFQAAHFRLAANMRELEMQFEHKASELRSAFVRANYRAALRT